VWVGVSLLSFGWKMSWLEVTCEECVFVYDMLHYTESSPDFVASSTLQLMLTDVVEMRLRVTANRGSTEGLETGNGHRLNSC
jgi:hypothetical protein